MRASLFMTFLLSALAGQAAAQQSTLPSPPSGERVASIIAVVGDSAITNIALMDAVVQRFALEKKQPQFQGPEFDQIRREVLDNEITELVLLQTAQQDTTIKLNDDDVRRTVDQQLARQQKDVGGLAQFDRLLQRNGTTLAEFREYMTAETRKNEMIKQYLAKVRQKRQPPPITDKELREFYEGNKASLEAQWGPKPALVTLDQVVLMIPPSDSADAAAKARADSVFAKLRAGEDFETLAKRYTEEPGGRDRGGDLGWVKESEVVREFARITFSTPAGAYSYPFRTSFGWHILKVERQRGGEAKVRHMLFVPAVTDADIERAVQRGDSIATLLKNGADVAPLARKFGDPEFDTRLGPIPPESYQQTYGIEVGEAAAGTVLGPTPFGEDARRRIIVARVVERTTAGNWSLDDQQVRDVIEPQLKDEKLMKELVGELRRGIYVKVIEP